MASSSASPPHLGNSFNVETEINLLAQSEQPPHGDVSTWDIFLSHSGAQKGFVEGLFRMLHPLYKVFYDRSRASLPLGAEFPPLIFRAAETCKLAIVVLSNEFFSSKWPMLELSAFIDAMPSSGVKVLPLFYELSPDDLKDKAKLQEWHERWDYFASQGNRIKVSSWDRALKKLRSINGLIFEKSVGELDFIEKIMLAIYQLVPLPIKSSHNGIRGRDRLCKEIIDTFEELERRPLSLGTADRSKVYLLGVYGLPGSGKTTLCGCLRDHFSSTFAGKVLHLKLPSNPADLLESAKQLFELTNFGYNKKKPLSFWEEPLSKIENLSQVFSILRDNNLQNLRVFIMIDNIASQESIELVEAILHLGVGAGSRVMLVAQSRDTLRPLLNIPKDQLYDGHIHYVCDSMRVPSINEEEATAILMQPAGGLGLPLNYTSIIEEKFSARHREIIARVTRMCAFSDNSVRIHRGELKLLYLPRALKIIGSQLRSIGMDLEKWERRLPQLDTMVKNLKEDAVREIVDYSYKNLHQNLKLIFLDVALFLVPCFSCSCFGYESAVELLSFMHGCKTETIKGQIKELARLCFLDLGFSSRGDQSISVSDFFLEFANTLADASSMYQCWRPGIIAGDAQEIPLDLYGMVRTSNTNVRSLILEVDEKCERFDFPEGLSSVKAVVVRKCKSLAVLGLAGLTSLAILFMEDCPKLRQVKFDPCHPYTLRCVEWVRKDESLRRSCLRSLLREEAWKATLVKQFLKKGWCSLWDLGRPGYWHQGRGYGPQRALNGLMTIASQFKALQTLTLQGTGITNLRDLSSYWPQLRVLKVLEDCLEEIELGNLPHLKQFFFGDEKKWEVFTEWYSLMPIRRESRMRARMSQRPKLLAGCPELEELRICRPSCEDGMGALVIPSPNLRTMWLRDIFCGEPVLPDFTSSADSLEEIVVTHHLVLQRIDFTHQFTSLVRIFLQDCPSLVKITGLECLPRLRDLKIKCCLELQAVENLEGLRMLECLDVWNCPVLILTPSGLSTLQRLDIWFCRNVQVATSYLKTLSALRSASCRVFGKPLKLQNLVWLERLTLLSWEVCEGQAAKQVLLCGSSGDAKCDHANENAQLQSMQYVPLFVVGESAPASLFSLTLWDVRDLICLHGVHRLLSLEYLGLYTLPQLTCLQGLECLTNLQHLRIWNCTAVERLPSLCTLVNLTLLCTRNCVNLKSLEGCDKMGLLETARFSGCENMEQCPVGVARSPQSSCPPDLKFRGCKFASIEAMVGWVVDDEVAAGVWRASVDALGWELTKHLLEKTKERMELAELLVETLGVYFTSKLPALTDHTIFDFQPWVESLKAAWSDASVKRNFPRGLERLMEELGRVPLKGVLQQCKHDAQFRTSVARCLLETNSEILHQWIGTLKRKLYGWWDLH